MLNRDSARGCRLLLPAGTVCSCGTGSVERRGVNRLPFGSWAGKAQITQQRSANHLLKSDLPKTVINVAFVKLRATEIPSAK
jgi:hypothetical protein